MPAFHGLFDNVAWLALATGVVDALTLWSIWTGAHRSTKARVVWTAIVLVIPLLGAVGWFLLGRERRRIR